MQINAENVHIYNIDKTFNTLLEMRDSGRGDAELEVVVYFQYSIRDAIFELTAEGIAAWP